MTWHQDWKIKRSRTRTTVYLPHYKYIPRNLRHKLVVFHKNIDDKDRFKFDMIVDILEEALTQLTPGPSLLERFLHTFSTDDRLQKTKPIRPDKPEVAPSDSPSLGGESNQVGGD